MVTPPAYCVRHAGPFLSLLPWCLKTHFFIFFFRYSELYSFQSTTGLFWSIRIKRHNYRMNTTQLQWCIQCDRILRDHVTVCAADHLPMSLTAFPYAFIVNTENHIQRGKHWCAFYVYRKGCGEFFDSYGHESSYYNNNFDIFFKKYASENGLINRRRLQSSSSNVCGLYCLFYLVRRY